MKLVFTVTHALNNSLHAILCPDREHKPAKTIIDGSFRHFNQDVFLTWHCDVIIVQYVTSRESEKLALWHHIRRFFLHAQIGAKAIFTSENNREYRFPTNRYPRLSV